MALIIRNYWKTSINRKYWHSLIDRKYRNEDEKLMKLKKCLKKILAFID